MRARVVGLTAAGLGGSALAVALLVSAWPGPAPERLAPDASFEMVVAGQGSYLDPVSLVPRSSDALTITVRVSGDDSAGDADGNTALWRTETVTTDTASGVLVATRIGVVCLDRQSAAAVSCAAESLDGRPVDVEGLTVAFPPDTPRRDHDLWNATVVEPLPARYAGTEEVRGLEVLRFEQEVPEQVIGAATVPAGWFGPSGADVAADIVHSGTRTLLVEPVSGVVVSSEESPLTVLRAADGRPGPVLLSGTFRSTGESVAAAVARAREARDRQAGVPDALPWAVGAAGLVLLAGGVLTARRGPAATPPGEDEPASVPVLVA